MGHGHEGRKSTTEKVILATVVAATVSVLLLVLAVQGAAAVRSERLAMPTLRDVPESAWERLSQKRIYFGHQSVGFNIIAGIEDLMRTNPQIRLNIVETDDPEGLGVPVFSHSRVGQNRRAKSKIDAFVANMTGGIARQADIAFFKFCYADVDAETDIRRVFSDYKRAMSDLKARYPDTTFVHVTVPLTSIETGIKAGVKRLLGRPVEGYEDNFQRSQYNAMLRKEYEGKEPIFDLATTEATSPRGELAVFEKDGVAFSGMFPAYTYDGGHLTEQGRSAAAQQLLILLANVAE